MQHVFIALCVHLDGKEITRLVEGRDLLEFLNVFLIRKKIAGRSFDVVTIHKGKELGYNRTNSSIISFFDKTERCFPPFHIIKSISELEQ